MGKIETVPGIMSRQGFMAGDIEKEMYLCGKKGSLRGPTDG